MDNYHTNLHHDKKTKGAWFTEVERDLQEVCIIDQSKILNL